MVKKPNADDDSKNADSGQNNVATNHLRWVLIGGGLAVLGLLLASIYWPNLTERTKFFTGNLLNLVIAIAVIAQVLINRKQWQAMHDGLERTDRVIEKMEDSLIETRKSVKYSEAAYIAITNASLIQFGQGQATICRMLYANSGNTPAYNVRVYGHMNLWDSPQIPSNHEKLKDIEGVEQSQHLIAPNGVRDHHVRMRGALTPDNFQRIEKGLARFYIWGIITYEDIFGRERWTTFCHMQVGPNTNLLGCGSNNDADRQ